MSGVNVKKLVEKMELTVFTPHIDLEQVQIKKRDVNRPALQLNGYFEHFQ